MTFIGNSDLEQYLNIDVDASWESWVAILATAIQTEAERVTGYEFTKHVHTTFVDGGQQRVWLPVPAKAIDLTEPVTITVYNDLTGLYDPYPYLPLPKVLRDGSITLNGLGYGPEAVQIDYAVGWDSSTFPKDLKQALVELLAAKWSVATAASTAANSGSDDAEATVKSISIGSLRKEFLVTDASGSAASVAKQLQPQVETALATIRSYRRAGGY